MSKLAEIQEFQEEGYNDFPDLGEEHVRLLLAVVEAELENPMLGEMTPMIMAETCRQVAAEWSAIEYPEMSAYWLGKAAAWGALTCQP